MGIVKSTKWVWCFLALSSGPWSTVSSVNVRTPEIIEAQAKFFQDFFSVQLSPYKIEFGHVCEDPNTWEQRYEKKDFKNHRDMGKVRWGDRKGGYGEHYWDLNHAGHAEKQASDDDYDDGPDNEELQDYPETVEQSDKYEGEEYDPNASDYKKTSRPKRENSKVEMQYLKGEQNFQEEPTPIQKWTNIDKTIFRRQKIDSKDVYDVDLRTKYLKDNLQKYNIDDTNPQPSKINHLVLSVGHKVEEENPNGFVSYEAGRKHYKRQAFAAPVFRPFLEAFTGHFIDRVTGKAYVLQPVNHNNHPY
ncbi:uncharacterized protein LOC112045227 isoform X2 [Bicyclus anynana]|uniref:Uncharacterized protein LOC112045227 isoform X2 n=1 Tax=Bicyclus anynana TaxID=110368 RepID=A0ABM3LH50_BICAN|nr:uncharacterized protein LOC112045227 isoform X2 [Bicyclus anynana]XP_052738372.1 uncharacterized protein LOC112045227 isoform X2 [Bicyclus anynana]